MCNNEQLLKSLPGELVGVLLIGDRVLALGFRFQDRDLFVKKHESDDVQPPKEQEFLQESHSLLPCWKTLGLRPVAPPVAAIDNLLIR